MNRLQNTQYILDGLPEMMQLDTGLRKSQIQVLNTYLTADMYKKQTGIFNLATGFGKTRIMSILALAYKRKNPGGKVLIVVPNTSLIKDENGDGVVKKFKAYNKKDLQAENDLDFGTFYGEGQKSTDSEFTVTTYASLAKYASKIDPKNIGLLLLDEAHHALSEARSDTIRQFSNAAQYGMTATPCYDPEKDLKQLLKNYIATVDIKEAIEDGSLADTKNVIMVSGTPVDLTKVPKVAQTGDYNFKEFMKALSQAMHGDAATSGNEDNWRDVHRVIANQIASFYQDYEDDEAGKIFGKKCMINCRSQREAEITAATINRFFGKMMASYYVSGNAKKENETVLDSFVNGNLPILCQVGKLSEGFDFPDLDLVINFPTHSRVREAQLGGRAIRKPRNRHKTALVIDIAFAHPDSKNVIDAIHINGQVLFQDILGEPAVKEDGRGGGGGGRKTTSAVRLKGFKLISDTKELLYLSQQAKEIENRRIQDEVELHEGYTSRDVAKKLGLVQVTATKLIKRYQDKTVMNPETGRKESYTKPMKDRRGVDCIGFTQFGFEKVMEEYKESRQGYTSDDVAKELGISWDLANKLIKRYQDKTVINPKTGKEEPCTKQMKNEQGQVCIGLTQLGFEKVTEEYKESRLGYTSGEVAKKLSISKRAAKQLIMCYCDKTVINSETGKEESCIKQMRNEQGQACIGFTQLGFEKASKEYLEKQKHQCFTPADVAKKLDITFATAKKLIEYYCDKTVVNPETGKEEPCTKQTKNRQGDDSFVFTQLGFEKASKEYQEEYQGYTSGDVVKKLGINSKAAGFLIKRYQDKTVINPETGKEEPCTKQMRNAKGTVCLGFTQLGFEKAIQEYQEDHLGYAAVEVSKKFGICWKAADTLIKRYQDKTVMNPETGRKESYTKPMKDRRGVDCIGFTQFGFEKVMEEYRESRQGYTSGDVVKKLGISPMTANRLMKHYLDKTVINPETGKEEPCTKQMRNATGTVCLGFTQLGFEKVLKEYKEKQKSATTLRPTLKKASEKGEKRKSIPKAPNPPKVVKPREGNPGM